MFEVDDPVQFVTVRAKSVEPRVTRLAHAKEIAQAMLQRQQANAVVVSLTRRGRPPRAPAVDGADDGASDPNEETA
jgi:hypothetical protein